MILDTLDSSFRYETLHPLFPSAFAFLRRPDLDALACGRIDLAGDDALYALIQTYETQPPAEGKPEAHRRYLDIQYVVSGSECVAYAPLAGLTPCQPFDEAGDYGLYRFHLSRAALSRYVCHLLPERCAPALQAGRACRAGTKNCHQSKSFGIDTRAGFWHSVPVLIDARRKRKVCGEHSELKKGNYACR